MFGTFGVPVASQSVPKGAPRDVLGRKCSPNDLKMESKIDLREFVNYRHPGPRRVWKVGSELQSTTLDPVDPVDWLRVPKYGFV